MWLIDWFFAKWGLSGPPHVQDGETVDQARKRLALPMNINPLPNPNWERPPAPSAPPAPMKGLCFYDSDGTRIGNYQELLAELEKYKRLYKDSQYNEQLLAKRIGIFKKDWPDIHKRYFTIHGEVQRAAGVKTPPPARKRK